MVVALSFEIGAAMSSFFRIVASIEAVVVVFMGQSARKMHDVFGHSYCLQQKALTVLIKVLIIKFWKVLLLPLSEYRMLHQLVGIRPLFRINLDH